MTNNHLFSNLPFGSVGFHITSALPLQTLKESDYTILHRMIITGITTLERTLIFFFNTHYLEKEFFIFPEKSYIQEANDLFLVQIPGDSQYALPSDSDHWDVLYLEFSTECLPLLYYIHQSSGPTFHLDESCTLPEQMRDLYLNATSNQLESVFDNSKAAYSFLLDLTSYALYHPKLTSPRVTLAKNYIDTHFYNVSLNLDEISDAVGLSKYHLCREFTHLYGTSPGKYLTNLRIQKSCILLLQNRYHTIGDIASMVGFSNDNYFCKVFRKSLGITPTQYRIQNQNYDLVRVLHDSHPCVPSDK